MTRAANHSVCVCERAGVITRMQSPVALSGFKRETHVAWFSPAPLRTLAKATQDHYVLTEN